MALKILVPTDFSERSLHALEVTARLFCHPDTQFTLLNVVPLPLEALGAGLAAPDSEEIRQLEWDLRELAAGFAISATVQIAVLEDPGACILRVASEQSCDLIAIGTRGRGGIDRALFGSVADHVIRHADSPVLAIRNPGLAAAE